MRDHFLEIFCKFKPTIEFVLVRSSFFRSVQTLYCKPVLQLKEEFSKFLEELLFGTYHKRVGFLDKTEKFLLLSTTDALKPILKFSKQAKENICGGVNFL